MSRRPETDQPRTRTRGRIAAVAGVLVPVLMLAGGGWYWQSSLLPDTYNVMDMGFPDYGGGPVPANFIPHDGSHTAADMAAMPGQTSVTSLVGPSSPADVSVTLTARKAKVQLTGETPKTVDGYTLNGTSPGPQITARAGQLVEVRLNNDNVDQGVALHWHGVDVPNGEDGVAGVTQDAVMKGGSFTYRFVAKDPGTYWYHSHQVSDDQVKGGMFGSLVVLPASAAPPKTSQPKESVALVHTYSGYRTINGATGTTHVDAKPGEQVRVRVINTNNGPLRTWVAGSSYRVLAVDGRDVQRARRRREQDGRPRRRRPRRPAGHRPRRRLGRHRRHGRREPRRRRADERPPVTANDPGVEFDQLSYGTPTQLAFDPANPTRRFTYSIGRRPGLFDGKPGFVWTINGHQFPDVPMFVVQQGDVVQMTIKNSSGQVHPMHLHGHHAVVLSRNGQPATGSPWIVDSLNVENGQSYVVAFVADNPGVWMDHCHNLPHASQGLVTHLMYAGVTTPFVVGGGAHNDPE